MSKSVDKPLLHCYNRGCGQMFDPKDNKNDSCRHHPGVPFFHDAYKGWTCCNKKCTDFTEFLNIKGCTVSMHSNVKMPEPEKVTPKIEIPVQEFKPMVETQRERPPFDARMTVIRADIAASFRAVLAKASEQSEVISPAENTGEVVIGTTCHNAGCNVTYTGPESLDSTCIYHPGVPIFHEGLKYWSCCQKKTSDFNVFLSQQGCERGSHVWTKEVKDKAKKECRWDWHQTGTHVVVSIYAKDYCPEKSSISLNPIRLVASLVFPSENNARFDLDLELKGVIEVESSCATMFGTKVEVNMRKADAGSWSKLHIRREIVEKKEEVPAEVETITPKIEDVDLSDL